MSSGTAGSGIVDEHAARLVAGFVVVIAIVAIVGGWQWLFGVLALDFAVRAFGLQRLSPLAIGARSVLAARKIAPKPAYAPPKRFAAQVGLGFTVVAFALWTLGQPVASTVVGLALVAAASLEAFANFCVACWIYAYLPRRSHVAS
jgi:hypothetical protein